MFKFCFKQGLKINIICSLLALSFSAYAANPYLGAPTRDDDESRYVLMGASRDFLNGYLYVNTESKAIRFREGESFSRKDGFSEEQIKILNNRTIRNMPVAIAVMREIDTKRYNQLLNYVDGYNTYGAVVGTEIPGHGVVQRAVLGNEIKPKSDLKTEYDQKAKAFINCAQFHESLRNYALTDLLKNMDYASGNTGQKGDFITKIINNKVYDNTLANSSRDDHILFDEIFYNSIDNAINEVSSKNAIATRSGDVSIYADIPIPEAGKISDLYGEKARLTTLNALLYTAMVKSPETRAPFITGIVGGGNSDSDIAATSNETLFDQAGSLAPLVGGIGNLIGEAAISIGSFFVGVKAVVYLHFIKYLVALAEMFILMITPVLLIVGIAAPSMAWSMIMTTIAFIVVIKAIPITFTLINALLSMMYYFASSSSGMVRSVDEGLILWAAATMYTGLIGTTLMLMPKAISSRAGSLTKLDKAAEDIANQVGKAVQAVAITAAAMAAAGFAGAVGAKVTGSKGAKALKALKGGDGKTPDAATAGVANKPEGEAGEDGLPQITDQTAEGQDAAMDENAEGVAVAKAGAEGGDPTAKDENGMTAAQRDFAEKYNKLGMLGRAGVLTGTGLKQAAQVFTRSASNIPVLSQLLREANPMGAYREGRAMSEHMLQAGGWGEYNKLEAGIKMKQAFDYEKGIEAAGREGIALGEDGMFHARLENTKGAAMGTKSTEMAAFRGKQEQKAAFKERFGYDLNGDVMEEIKLDAERQKNAGVLSQHQAMNEFSPISTQDYANAGVSSQRTTRANTMAAAGMYQKYNETPEQRLVEVGRAVNTANVGAATQYANWVANAEIAQQFAENKAMKDLMEGNIDVQNIKAEIEKLNKDAITVDGVRANLKAALDDNSGMGMLKVEAIVDSMKAAGMENVDVASLVQGADVIADSDLLQNYATLMQEQREKQIQGLNAKIVGIEADMVNSPAYQAELAKIIDPGSHTLTSFGLDSIRTAAQGSIKRDAIIAGADLFNKPAIDAALVDDKLMMEGLALDAYKRHQEAMGQEVVWNAREEDIYKQYVENYDSRNVSASMLRRVSADMNAAPKQFDDWADAQALIDLDRMGMDWSARSFGKYVKKVSGLKGESVFGDTVSFEGHIFDSIEKEKRSVYAADAKRLVQITMSDDQMQAEARQKALKDLERSSIAAVKQYASGSHVRDKKFKTEHEDIDYDSCLITFMTHLRNAFTDEIKSQQGNTYQNPFTGDDVSIRKPGGELDHDMVKAVAESLAHYASMSSVMNFKTSTGGDLLTGRSHLYETDDGGAVGYKLNASDIKSALESLGLKDIGERVTKGAADDGSIVLEAESFKKEIYNELISNKAKRGKGGNQKKGTPPFGGDDGDSNGFA